MKKKKLNFTSINLVIHHPVNPAPPPNFEEIIKSSSFISKNHTAVLYDGFSEKTIKVLPDTIANKFRYAFKPESFGWLYPRPPACFEAPRGLKVAAYFFNDFTPGSSSRRHSVQKGSPKQDSNGGIWGAHALVLVPDFELLEVSVEELYKLPEEWIVKILMTTL